MFALPKLILNFFSGAPKLPLILKVSPQPNTKTLFMRLSGFDHELLSIPKIITFLAWPLSKLHSACPSNAIP